jgi:hypothetical protein
MFGAVGLYLDGTFCGIIIHDTLYLKADAYTARDFEANGMGPFNPVEDKPAVMRSCEVPGDVLKDLDDGGMGVQDLGGYAFRQAQEVIIISVPMRAAPLRARGYAKRRVLSRRQTE